MTPNISMAKSAAWVAIEEEAGQVRDALRDNMDQMAVAQREWNLPTLADWFPAARNGLDRTDFNVVICGEVKHGKSSLLNAIIGQDILPTGVTEATCQVFRISHCETESYTLVFTDGHNEPIRREDLARYGSQSVIDQQGERCSLDGCSSGSMSRFRSRSFRMAFTCSIRRDWARPMPRTRRSRCGSSTKPMPWSSSRKRSAN